MTDKEQTKFSTEFQMHKYKTMMNLLDELSKSKTKNLKSSIYTITEEIYELRKSISHTYRAESKYVPLEILNDNEKLKKFIKESQIQELYNDSSLMDLNFPLRFCIHPYYIYSYKSVCTKSYWSYDKDTLNICNQAYCTSCCDMSKDIIVSMIDKSPYYSNKITETTFTKYDIAEYYANPENIEQCKMKCKNEYTFDRLFKSDTLSIGTLGKSKLNPALSCIDIKHYGPASARNGTYWISIDNKQSNSEEKCATSTMKIGKPVNVTCDMETKPGGWLKILNYKSSNDIGISDQSTFPNNANVNQFIKLSNLNVKESQIKSIRFSCTMNTSPYQGIHFETENDSIKQLVVNNYLKSSDGSELIKRDDIGFPSEYLDLVAKINKTDSVVLTDEKNIQLVGSKMFTLASNKQLGWGIEFEHEFDGMLKKVSMCGELNWQKKDGKLVEYETTHEIYVLMHKPNKNFAFERYFKYISKNRK